MQSFKDGVLTECTTEEFVQSLHRHAGWADEEFKCRSDPAAHLGLMMSQAAGVVDVYRFEIQRLKKAFDILFPQPVKQEDGSEVDSSADENLDAAIIDLESHGRGDAVVIATMKRVLTQLVEARQTVND